MSQDKVVEFPGGTTLDLPTERVLQAASEADLSVAVVVGLDKEGIYFASTTGNVYQVLWLLEKAKRQLLEY